MKDQPTRNSKAAKRSNKGSRKRSRQQPGAARPPSATGCESIAVASPFVSDTRLTMELSGNWKTGGVLEVFLSGQPYDCVRLAPAPWAFLAILFMAAICAKSTRWFNAFVPTKEIAKKLEQEDVLLIAPANTIHKLASTIRRELESTKTQRLSRAAAITEYAWARQVIESRKGAGYRIALPPENLKLFFGATQFDPEGGVASGREGSAEQENGRL